MREFNKEARIRAENYFMSLMNQQGIPVKFVDDWFDFLIYDTVRVEVKSCQLNVRFKRNKKDAFRVGQFDFTKEENRQLLNEHNVWVCLILRHFGSFLVVGFVRSRDLELHRYLPLSQVRKLQPLCFDDWVNQINQEVKV